MEKVFEDKEFHGDATFFGALILNTVGTLTIDGTLSALLVSGALDVKGLLTVGVDDTGHDVKFFGATSGLYMLWDESANRLKIVGGSGADITLDSAGRLYLDGGGDTYILENSSNVIRFVIGGSSVELGGLGLNFNAGGSPLIRRVDSTATVPNLCSDRADIDTGVGASGANEGSLIANAKECARFYGGGLQQMNVEDKTAKNDNQTGSTIVSGSSRVKVSGVTTDANDWVVLPVALAGMDLYIYCLASSNFELRTPAASNEKINNVDSDGTQEYLCSDTDIIHLHCYADGEWIAQSYTILGALRTAVVPD